jgi:hypothetical protein
MTMSHVKSLTVVITTSFFFQLPIFLPFSYALIDTVRFFNVLQKLMFRLLQRVVYLTVISLVLSDYEIPDQVKLFHQYFSRFKHQFIRLQQIRFIKTNTILHDIPSSVSSLSLSNIVRVQNGNDLIVQILVRQVQFLTCLSVENDDVFSSIDIPFHALTHLTISYCSASNFVIPNFDELSNCITHLSIKFPKGK